MARVSVASTSLGAARFSGVPVLFSATVRLVLLAIGASFLPTRVMVTSLKLEAPLLSVTVTR
ncbi:hypothetical protein D9M70_618660 [compost metagenome]